MTPESGQPVDIACMMNILMKENQCTKSQEGNIPFEGNSTKLQQKKVSFSMVSTGGPINSDKNRVTLRSADSQSTLLVMNISMKKN